MYLNTILLTKIRGYDGVANAVIADVASKTTKTADVVVVVVSRVPPPHLIGPVPLGRRDDAIASPARWLPSVSAAMAVR